MSLPCATHDGSSRARPWRGVLRRPLTLALAVVVALGTAGAGVGQPGRGDAGRVRSIDHSRACASGTCYVAVSVATLWVKPWYPRAIDAPALGRPADPAAWVHALSTVQREWLVGRLETQALYGTRVTVIGHWHSWTHVAVPSQPTNRDARGYPGWVPTQQLTRTPPAGARTSAVIRSATAWLWTGATTNRVAGTRVMRMSYDTRLPVVRATSGYVEVSLIGGGTGALRRSDVVLRRAGAAGDVTRARLVGEARRFLGLPYLWGGTSGIAFDCSGFTYAVYRFYEITLSRDADQQAVHGAYVARGALRPGDLVFFRGSAGGPISHVGMYVGGGNMIDAPHTGAVIRIEPVASFGDYAGARRYLPR